ncbi:Crp/Fnr family transcriptional regulator [Paenibacillus sp. CAU 1782]
MRTYNKNEVILQPGDEIKHIGVVVEGKAQAFEVDVNGNNKIFTHLLPSDLFGEVLICAGTTEAPLTIKAGAKTVVLLIQFQKVLKGCTSSCPLHAKLVENMLHSMAIKTQLLNDKLSCVCSRTIRDKVESFLRIHRKRAGSNPFEIPFTRMEMADYLSVDRSALSAVLSSMRDEGVISFEKNQFQLCRE